MASAGTHGPPRRALDDSLQPSNTESNDKEPAQSSSLETALLSDIVERLEGVRAARRFEKLGMVHLLRLQVQISQLETHFWNRPSSLMLEESDSHQESRLFEKLMRYSKFQLKYQSRLQDLTRSRQSFARAKTNSSSAETHHERRFCVKPGAQEFLQQRRSMGKRGSCFFGSLLLSSSLPSDRNKQVSLLAKMGRLL